MEVGCNQGCANAGDDGHDAIAVEARLARAITGDSAVMFVPVAR
jgi:hypothetical protein